MKRTGISPPDPYTLRHDITAMAAPLTPPWLYHYAGRTQVSPVLAGYSDLGVGVFLGDSTLDNSANALWSAANPDDIFNMSIENGGVYLSAEPMVGGYISASNFATTPAANGNLVHQLADALVTAGTYDGFVSVPLGASNAAISDWASGGPLNERITVAFRRLAAVGLSASFVAIQIGANDTTLGTSQASYEASQDSVIATIRAAGFAGSILISATSLNGAGSTSSDVINAQASVIDNPSGIYAGPSTDSLAGANRWDVVHLSATGKTNFSSAWITQIELAPH